PSASVRRCTSSTSRSSRCSSSCWPRSRSRTVVPGRGKGERMTLAAENFLLPNGTLIVELIAFAIIVGIRATWVVPPVNRGAKERQERIRRQCEESEEAKAKAEAAEKEYRDAIVGMRAEAARLREEARAEGQQIVAEAREKALEEARRISQA